MFAVFLNDCLGGNHGKYFDYSLLLRSPSAGAEEPSQPSGVSLNRHARFCLPARARSFAPKSVFAVGSRLLVENRTDGQRGGGAVALNPKTNIHMHGARQRLAR
jgi:hypothetical protein